MLKTKASAIARSTTTGARQLPKTFGHDASHSIGTRALHGSTGNEANHTVMNDFIVSILESHPCTRDAKTYLGTFANKPKPSSSKLAPQAGIQPTIPPNTKNPLNLPPDVLQTLIQTQKLAPAVQEERQASPQERAALELLDPIQRRTALVKLQGPFTDRQLESICLGLVYLGKLGLVCVIVVARDDWQPGSEGERRRAEEDVMRVAKVLEAQGAKARPILGPAVRLGPKPKVAGGEAGVPSVENTTEVALGEEKSTQEMNAHTMPEDLVPVRSALRAGEIPILPPLALDSFSRMVAMHPNDVVEALLKGMVEVGQKRPKQILHHSIPTDVVRHPDSVPVESESTLSTAAKDAEEDDVDMTPLRLMIINREGGVPSYARNGLPHLLINLQSEHQHIHQTFDPSWSTTHPTSLSNLSLAKSCLKHMPPTSSAIVVSHRSPRSLIANLITNKPAQSSSLPSYLLSTGAKKVTPHTPTLIRNGLPMRVIQRAQMNEIDREKLTGLLEASFNRTLIQDAFYERLEKVLDYVIVAGDYAGACIVTEEPIPSSSSSSRRSLSYLDKFAVHPSHQGDGTVDFLWVALHDESFGLGLEHALNPNEGGKMGVGIGRDLVWRSRSNNPANKWYYERSSGHMRMADSAWTMFWCDAEGRVKEREGQLIQNGWTGARHLEGIRGKVLEGLSYVDEEGGEQGRLSDWAEVVESIPSSWVPLST
ncbi:Amino-acid acetyltransferase, mitochondrial [Tulasnella sp. JGI-2019a]|nr:Amino-acid acetyltransferase, mitochondrial [Tulasnella sp. JGI-2019a]